MPSFSSRHGYGSGALPGIEVRKDAPARLRAAIPLIAQNAGMEPNAIRDVVCEVLLRKPEENSRSDYPNVWNELTGLIAGTEWFRVYDIAEALHRHLLRKYHPEWADVFEERLNEFFVENGIGWKMARGEIGFRDSEVFADTTSGAVLALGEGGRDAAAREVHEALRDISRRPEPDIAGAIQHVIAALECVARDVTGEPNAALGQLVPALDLPSSLGAAVTNLWRFSSDGARRIREGRGASTEQAEFVVSIACALCIFLSRSGGEDA